MGTVKVTSEILSIINKIKRLAINYERHFNFKRKLGITGEVGEIVACHLFKLSLEKDGIKEGYDALDSKRKRVQIKSVRKQPGKDSMSELYKGRVGRFSKHKFDYCCLVIFNRDYDVQEARKIPYEELLPLFAGNKKRNPTIRQLRKIGTPYRLNNQISK